MQANTGQARDVPKRMGLGAQIIWLLVLAVPIASIAWTVTHEEVFREPREWCASRSRESHSLAKRKLFYLFTCEFCFSHWVALFFLLITRFHLLFADWRGYLIAFFALVWVANIYMNLYGSIRLDIHRERVEIKKTEREAEQAGSAQPLAVSIQPTQPVRQKNTEPEKPAA
jgi:hypothetical protein